MHLKLKHRSPLALGLCIDGQSSWGGGAGTGAYFPPTGIVLRPEVTPFPALHSPPHPGLCNHLQLQRRPCRAQSHLVRQRLCRAEGSGEGPLGEGEEVSKVRCRRQAQRASVPSRPEGTSTGPFCWRKVCSLPRNTAVAAWRLRCFCTSWLGSCRSRTCGLSECCWPSGHGNTGDSRLRQQRLFLS